jgi:hypothetical protein
MLALSNSGGGFADVAQLDYDAASSPFPLTLSLKRSRPFVISGGNVGIGETSPSAKLDIVHSGSGTRGIEVNSGSGALDGVVIIANGITATNYALLINNAGDKMRVDYSGNGYFAGKVGIACTDPQCKLDVSDNCIRLRASKTPTHSYGANGDKAGMIAWDSSYLYVCRGNYDGTTNIWRRISLPSGTW